MLSKLKRIHGDQWQVIIAYCLVAVWVLVLGWALHHPCNCQ